MFQLLPIRYWRALLSLVWSVPEDYLLKTGPPDNWKLFPAVSETMSQSTPYKYRIPFSGGPKVIFVVKIGDMRTHHPVVVWHSTLQAVDSRPYNIGICVYEWIWTQFCPNFQSDLSLLVGPTSMSVEGVGHKMQTLVSACKTSLVQYLKHILFVWLYLENFTDELAVYWHRICSTNHDGLRTGHTISAWEFKCLICNTNWIFLFIK